NRMPRGVRANFNARLAAEVADLGRCQGCAGIGVVRDWRSKSATGEPVLVRTILPAFDGFLAFTGRHVVPPVQPALFIRSRTTEDNGRQFVFRENWRRDGQDAPIPIVEGEEHRTRG